ncbi:MAG: flavodoxin domain-containing protein [Spirochaetales bacterium]|nr:flavodoxin domain-containing protein [Spirochaetales bacterium]
MNDMKISNSVKFVGVNDHKIDLFEGQFSVPEGMSYNSYLILDEKIAVMDSVDRNFGEEWLKNIENALSGKKPDFLVVQHMEMDHSANIAAFMKKYPDSKIVSSKMAFNLMKNMFGTDFSERQIVISEGSKVELGKHVLNFIAAPNVHWPEVMFTYESTEKILFSADGFGKFGALDVPSANDWTDEARRYYFGIVGKFGANVQAVLKKAANLEIQKICPLHGPVLDSNLEKYIQYYDTWSKYEAETDGIFIAYTSVYGNTKQAAEKLAKILKEKGCKNVLIKDLARNDIFECVADAFRYKKLVLASTTYNTEVFPKMREFIAHLAERNFQNRTVGFIENCSWAPLAAKTMAKMFEPLKEIKILEEKVTIKIAVNEEVEKQLENFAEKLI